MHVEYGPPGVSGVTHLQYLAGVLDDHPRAHALAVLATNLAAGVWAYAALTKKKKLARQAGWTAIAAVAVQAALTLQK